VRQLHYTVDARDGRGHRFAVSLELDVPPDRTELEVLLPVWTPGSYLVREHERHLGEIRARNAESREVLPWHKTAKNRFAIAAGPATRRLRLDYTVFAHELTVRTADLTEEHAFWNGVCLFLWPVSARAVPATIDLILPEGWQVFTWLALRRHAGGVQLRVEGLDQLADAAVLACPEARVVEFEAMGRPHRFVFEGLGAVAPPAELAGHTRAVIAEAARVFAVEVLPYARYDFLTLASDRGQGGLEHADGCVLLAPRTALASAKGYRDFLGLVAHEHFHVFNVKRMRPADLWQLDYERENHTTLLWVAEGFTAYYDDLLCRRAGAFSVAKYLQIVADNIAEVHRTPGRLVHSLADASYDAWIKFYRPDEDSKNSSQSYYVSGGLAAMCLDLEVRRLTRGARGLDDAMRVLWRRTFLEDRGFTHDDVVSALSQAAGRDLGATVDGLVRGPFDPDFAAALRPFGLVLEPARPSGDAAPFFGMQFQAGSTVVTAVQRGGPAARGGIAAGDEVVAAGGLRITAGNFAEVVRAVATPGAPVAFLLARRGQILQRTVEAEVPERRGGYTLEVAATSTAEQDALRRGWIGDDG
jgi:predicted metalloprotease with PDZ domain